MYWNDYIYVSNDSNNGLTLTWDVLKFIKPDINKPRFITININMRCIEIAQLLLTVRFLPGLTLTWDVLKFCPDDVGFATELD